MKDPFNNFEPNLKLNINSPEEQDKEEEALIKLYGSYENARSELWKLLIKAGILPEDKAPGEKRPYTRYSITELARLLEKITEEKETGVEVEA
jgi:hypothetical protein